MGAAQKNQEALGAEKPAVERGERQKEQAGRERKRPPEQGEVIPGESGGRARRKGEGGEWGKQEKRGGDGWH